jgi:hypothetical protein
VRVTVGAAGTVVLRDSEDRVQDSYKIHLPTKVLQTSRRRPTAALIHAGFLLLPKCRAFPGFSDLLSSCLSIARPIFARNVPT